MDSLLSDYPPIMTRAEVAEVIRVEPRTLSNWAAEGIGPRCFFMSPRTPRYRKGDLLQYLEEL